MKRTIFTIAATAALLAGVAAAGATETSPALLRQATKAATKAFSAFKDNRSDVALRYAERAVLYNPTNAEHRALLGQAYLRVGRFVSAETAFSDALRLDPANTQAQLGLALSQIALGRGEQARAVLEDGRGRIPAADFGLALALAGDRQEALAVLEPAARAADSTAKARQNLALVYALSGRWAEARATAAIDLGADQVDKRMIEWASFTRPRGSADQVASLLGVRPSMDSGMPQQLALLEAAPEAPQQAVAVEAAPVEAPAPVVQVAAVPESTVAPTPEAAGDEPYYMMAKAEAVAAQPEEAAPAPAAVAAPVQPVIQPVRQAAAIQPATSGYVVQLGAFSSESRLADGWSKAVHKANLLRSYTQVSTTMVSLDNRTLHRLSVSGFRTRAQAMDVCQRIRARGGECFVRSAAGDTPAQWVARNDGKRLAAR